MATSRKTQIEKIESVLLRNKKDPGITPASIARMAKVPRETVSKRVYDLRDTYNIATNWRVVNGKRTAFYRIAN